MAAETEPAMLRTEDAVNERYGAAAHEREEALCCPIDYDPQYLKVIPAEVLERDYGCGDPSRYVREGDTVLDLGSGSGKICFIAAQIVGEKGLVVGVDANPDMLALARRSAAAVAESLGYANVEIRNGRIEDLQLDIDQVETWLQAHPVRSVAELASLEAEQDRLRAHLPMIADSSVDIVISNCVLNLVRDEAKHQLIQEIYRTLRVGGRIAISDIVSDEVVPAELKANADLWSGCISGAFHEQELLRELEEAGFYGIEIDKWESEPFAVVEGIEFRSVTVTAHKGKQGACLDANEAIIYAGPWKRVEDDDGHVFVRGERTAVCAKTHRLLSHAPYASQTIGVQPRVVIADSEQRVFDLPAGTTRAPRDTKGGNYKETRSSGSEGSCC